MRHLPNLLTLLRIALTVPIVMLLLAQEYGAALGLMFVAGLSDALDGLLARRFGWVSRFGAVVDPLADKLLLVTSYLCLAITELVPTWLTALVLARDAVILGGAAAFRLLSGSLPIQPSLLGKLSTALQISLVLAALIEATLWPGSAWVEGRLVPLVALVTVASGLHYVWRWTALYRTQGRNA